MTAIGSVGRMLDALPPAAFWTAAELAVRKSWRFTWPDAALRELRDAIRTAGIAPGADLEALSPTAISGVSLAGLAADIAHELDHGSGVAWLASPAPSARFDAWELRLLTLTLAWQLGTTIERYGRLYDVIDRGGSYHTERIPVSQTRAETAFHTDSSAADCNPAIVGLLCVRPARTGGDSQVASAATVLQRIAVRDPDALEPLMQRWIRDIVTPGLAPTLDNLRANRIPIVAAAPDDGGLVFRYMRYWIERGHERAEVALPADAVRAMDRLDVELAAGDAAFTFQLRAGEVLLVNNHRVAHNRTEFIDDIDPASRRLLARFWIHRKKGTP